MTYQTIYSSESATPMQMDDLEEILEHARSNNAKKGITGALVYVDGVFLQILQGDSEVVQELMAKIARDVRHETVTVLKQGEIPAAIFRDWKMAYVSATAEQIAKWAGLSRTTAIPDILADMRNDPFKASQVAQSILSVLASDSDAGSKAE
jgi:Sensors of blue-light using FAD